MKKLTLIFFLILVFQISYIIKPIFPQEDKEAEEIIQVLKTYHSYMSKYDVASAMQCFSRDYSARRGEEITNFDEAKKGLEAKLLWVKKNLVNIIFEISNLKIVELDAVNNKAIVDFEWIVNGFNLDTLQDVSIKDICSVHLAKENDVWKITKCEINAVPSSNQ